jgi:hypothetical protein
MEEQIEPQAASSEKSVRTTSEFFVSAIGFSFAS